MQIHDNNNWELYEFDYGLGWQSVYTPAISQQWVYITGVCDGISKYLYINGALASSTIVGLSSTYPRSSGFDFAIGSDNNINIRYWNGSIDEVTCASTARSSDWIKLCYSNQKAVDALITFK